MHNKFLNEFRKEIFMSKCKLVTYEPLCMKAKGRKIVAENPLVKPYFDASFRREPSFECKYPGITSLCRKSKLAPLLQVGDRVVYITKKDYYGQNVKNWRVVAILEVEYVMQSHQEAANWYKDKGVPLPSNCIIEGNKRLTINETSVTSEKKIKKFEGGYQQRVKEIPQYNICRKIKSEFETPKIITEQDMKIIFNKIPGTQNPKNLDEQQFNYFLNCFN